MLEAADVELTRGLERGKLPEAGFPHRSHLRVAWVYLAESPSIDLALERMSETLRRFAASVGKAEKYSSSITAFWMLQLAAARAVLPGAGIDAVLRAYPRLLDTTLIRADDSHHVITSGLSYSPRDAPDRPLPRRPA